MWSLARRMAQYSNPLVMDNLSCFFMNILPYTLTNLNILLQAGRKNCGIGIFVIVFCISSHVARQSGKLCLLTRIDKCNEHRTLGIVYMGQLIRDVV